MTKGFLERLFHLYHRLGITSNVLVSAQYSSHGLTLTKPIVTAALHRVVEAHPPLRLAFVRRPSAKKGQLSLHRAMLHTIDLDSCVEYLDGSGVDTTTIERAHNEWLWTADEPDRPLWKLLVIGERDVIFVFHHMMADGLSGLIFHREFLAALDSLSPADSTKTKSSVIHADPATTTFPLEPMDECEISLSIMEMIWTRIVWVFVLFFWGNKRIFSSLPPAPPYFSSVTGVAKPEQRIVTRISSYRVPAATMSKILDACRANGTTFTALFITMLTATLATDYFPEATIGCTGYACSLRPVLPMKRISGPKASSAGVMVNAVSSGQEIHWLGRFRKIFIKGDSTVGEKMAGRKVDKKAAWDATRAYKEKMNTTAAGKAARSWMGATLIGSDLDDLVNQGLPNVGLFLAPTYFVSNIGSFSGGHDGAANANDESKPQKWTIDDAQFSAGATNGNQRSHGIVFHMVGVKGRDTVINATYEDGIMSREMADGILRDVMSNIEALLS